MNNWLRRASVPFFLIASVATLFAGGSGLNVVVVVNQNSSNSVQLGNYYCEKRSVPPQNVLRINWPGGTITWTKTDFNTFLRAPLVSMIASRQLTNQIEFVALSMDIPYRISELETNGQNATTSALFYGFMTNDCPACQFPGCTLPAYTFNAYAGSEGIFRQTPPVSASSNSWLVMMLTSSNLASAMALVDRGVASDGLFPTQPVFLGKSDDPFRNGRFPNFDDAIFNTRLRGDYLMRSTNISFPSGLANLLGYQNGKQQFGLNATMFVPGAMADNLTSASGYIFEDTPHTDALDFLNAGATASFGTIVEPCSFLEKFASPQNYFYQARGFSIAECYYQSVTNPYQGILVGEPLAAPFAVPCSGAWNNLPANAVLGGTTNLSVQFTPADATRPVQQVDLFLNGTFLQTITNIPPRTNNILYVTVNGFPTNYTVPANATLKSIASNLTTRLNQNAYSNATKVIAYPRGDRIELRSFAPLVSGDQIPVTVSNFMGTATALTTFLSASRTNLLNTMALGLRGFFVTNVSIANSFLLLTVTKTNGTVVAVGATNTTGLNTGELVQALANAINSNPGLTGPDGVFADDVFSYNAFNNILWIDRHAGEFNLLARAPGWREAQIKAHLTGSANFTRIPAANVNLEENLNDLRPRNHLYVTAGLTNLPLTFGFNTMTQADGYHELTAVAYEGSHVRTQKRISQNVRMQNTTLSATFTCLLCDTNTALETILQFAVVANTNNITKIEFFSTGGLLAVSNGVSSTTFSIAATNLGIGLHPFCTLVTRADGKQYRTETKWIRIIGAEPPFTLTALNTAPTLAWLATAGRRYEILSVTNATNAFLLRDAVTPTNSSGKWSETNNSAPQRLYRVRTQQ